MSVRVCQCMCASEVHVYGFSCFNGEALPVRGPSLAVLIHLQHDLGGVKGRAGIGVQEKLLVLSQILSWSLLGQSGTVEQLSL